MRLNGHVVKIQQTAGFTVAHQTQSSYQRWFDLAVSFLRLVAAEGGGVESRTAYGIAAQHPSQHAS